MGKTLFILDNCELIEEGGQARHLLEKFLQEFEQLTLLAVSQRPFRLGKRTEYIKQVEPLNYPGLGELHKYVSYGELLDRRPDIGEAIDSPQRIDELFEKLQAYDAVELFRQTAVLSTEQNKEAFRLTNAPFLKGTTI